MGTALLIFGLVLLGLGITLICLKTYNESRVNRFIADLAIESEDLSRSASKAMTPIAIPAMRDFAETHDIYE